MTSEAPPQPARRKPPLVKRGIARYHRWGTLRPGGDAAAAYAFGGGLPLDEPVRGCRGYCALRNREGSMGGFMLLFLLLIFGVLVGMMSGLLGIGGGIALVPGLMFLFSFTQREAQGTSLAVMIPPIGIFAAMVYYQRGDVRLPVVAFVALGFMLGAYIGAKLLPLVPLTALRVAFGCLLLYVGFMFVLTPVRGQQLAALPAGIAALFAWVLRRGSRERAQTVPPAGEEIEYHI